MITSREAITGIDGAMRLAMLDAKAKDAFDVSAKGFWNSFAGIWIVAPFWLWIIIKQPSQMAEIAAQRDYPIHIPEMEFYITVEILLYLLNWVLFPVIVVPICRQMNVMGNYVRFIIARNWGNVLLWFGLTCPIALLFSLQIIDYPTIQSVSFLSLMVQNVYLWYITQVTLGIGGGPAALIVGLDIFLFIAMAILREVIYLF